MSKVAQTKPASTLEHISLDFLPMMLSTHSAFSQGSRPDTQVLQNVSKFLSDSKGSVGYAEWTELNNFVL